MSESVSSGTRKHSPLRRWVVIAAAAVPASMAAGTMMNGTWTASAFGYFGAIPSQAPASRTR